MQRKNLEVFKLFIVLDDLDEVELSRTLPGA